MTNSDFFVGATFFSIGIALMSLYVFAAKTIFKVRLDLVQVVMYKINTESMPVWKKILEAVLRILKFFGLILAVVGPFIAFH